MAGGPGSPPRAQLIGTGLIGGSVGLALREAGWHVTGTDADPSVALAALAAGAVDEVGEDAEAELVVLAMPVGGIVDAAKAALEHYPGAAVTDVGSVKASIVEQVDDPRFVGGHPMAGSEQEGVAGARASMFAGATWVLTPTATTDPAVYARVHHAVSETGAEIATMEARDHDEVVATVSHVPHLTAAALMGLASERGQDHAALLRIAAGGFRDMTRIASGHPGIWPDICAENAQAIDEVLGALVEQLGELRRIVAAGDRGQLLERLETARTARTNLPLAAPPPESMVEMRVIVQDRPGELATVATTATNVGVNLYDVEIAHSSEGQRGVLVMLVSADQADRLAESLEEQGYVVAERRLR